MAISSSTRKAGPFLGNDATTVFPFAFKVFTAADLLVVNTSALGVESDLELDVDYTVTLNADQDNDPGGSITRATALPTGERLTITSDVAALQSLVLTNNGGFYPRVINDAFDKITIIAQQLAEKVGRSLKLPISSTASPTLPDPVANSLIAWNSSGDGFANVAPGTLVDVAAYSEAFIKLFDGDGVETDFELDYDPGVLANLSVSVSGVVQVGGEDFTWIGTTITFTTPPPAATRIQVRYTRVLPPVDLDAATTAAAASAAAAAEDAIATAADRVQTGLDRVATAADRVQTGEDATATAADRVQTGLDRTAAATSALLATQQTDYSLLAAEASPAGTDLLGIFRSSLKKVTLTTLAAFAIQTASAFVPDGTGAQARTVEEKLREATASAEDFGAIGDGTLHPVSEWIIPGILGRYADLTALQVDYPHVTSTSDSIDFAAIQAGWNKVSAAGGGVLGLGGGKTYVLSNTSGSACLTAKSNVSLVGSSTTFKLGAAAGSCAMIRGTAAVSGVHLEGITFDGNNPAITTDTYGVRLEDITDLTIDYCIFQDLRLDAVLVGQTTVAERVTIKNSIFQDIGVAGVGANGVRAYNNRGVEVDNCSFYDFIISPIDTNPTPGGDVRSELRLTRNYIHNSTSWLAGYSAISLLGHRVTCEDNTIINGGWIVVHDYVTGSETTRDYKITGNSLEFTINGVIVNQGENSDILVADNIIYGFEQFGVQVVNPYGTVARNPTTVVDNIITDTSTDYTYTNSNQPVSILLLYANNVVANDNQCITPRFAGLWSSGSSNVSMNDNYVVGHQGRAPSDLTTFTGGGIVISAGGFGAPVAVLNVFANDNTIVDFLTAHSGSPQTSQRTGGITAYNDTSGAVTMHRIVIKGNNVFGGNGIGIHTNTLDSVYTDGNTTVDCVSGGEVDVGSVLRLANVLKGSYAAAPTTGAHVAGTIAVNSSPSAGEPWGWVCRADGTPGTWDAIYGAALSGSATYNAPSLATMTTTTTTVTVTGAAVGDFVTVSFELDQQGLMASAYVSAADTVTVVLFNPTLGAVDLGSTTLRARVQKAA